MEYSEDKKFIKLNNEERKVFEDVKILRKQGKHKEARNIARRFPDVAEIQSQIMKICILEGQYREAKRIAEKFPDNPVIQSQMMTIYINRGKYQEANQIAKEFPNHLPIQSQKVGIHIKKREYEEAKKIGKNFPEEPIIQSQMVTIYMREEEYEKAKNIGQEFPNFPGIQSQMVTMCINRGEYKEAKKIATKFPNNPIIQTQIASIIGEEETLNTILEKINNNPNDATINDEIEQLDDKWLKVILNSALGEKMNMKMPAQQFIKKMEKQGYIDEEHKPIISALKQRLEKKSKIFDMEFYENLITEITDSKDNMRSPSQDDEERI